jgi:hypothetical protein
MGRFVQIEGRSCDADEVLAAGTRLCSTEADLGTPVVSRQAVSASFTSGSEC